MTILNQPLAGAGPMAVLPLGLLDALGIKSGEYPRYLLREIRPAVDLLELLATSACTEVVTATLAQAAGTTGYVSTTGLLVPQGETWFVLGGSTIAAPGAAEAISLHYAVCRVTAAGSFRPVKRFDTSGSTTAGARLVSSGSVTPFWIGSGLCLGFGLETITTAGTINVTTEATILRCRR